MRKIVTLAAAAGVSALALGAVAPQPAKAADMYMPQAQYGAPPPPPQNYAPSEGYAYPPPPPATVLREGYAYPPPPPVYYPYPEQVYFGLARPYYVGPYWRGYGPRFAYGYGRWGHGYRRW
jgi:hypothetical protein